MDEALWQVENYTTTISEAQAKSGISASASTKAIFTYAGTTTGPKLTAYNAAGVNMSWYELEYALLTMEDWMDRNTYGWGSASVYDGTDQVGIIYISL